MTKSVAILGCGPAGLLAAHAARLSGWSFQIYSKKQKSQLFGAQYLHEPIPYYTWGPGVMLEYRLNGTPEEYRHKVYGPTWDGQTSPEDYPEPHRAWDLRTAYDNLWFDYGENVVPIDIKNGLVEIGQPGSMDMWMNKYDLVISTVPKTIWDDDERNFQRAYIWAMGDGDYERVHMHRPDPFTVVCDGTNDHQWYRVSNIFGYSTMEWPWRQYFNHEDVPPARGAARVAKPLRYTGVAASDFIHLGRYAQWEKGVLTSDVFKNAMEVFRNDSIE